MRPKTSQTEFAARLHRLAATITGRLYAAAREVKQAELIDPGAMSSRLVGLAAQAGADIERLRQELSAGRAGLGPARD